ncbi:MAG: DNA alkylation repair protein [Eubacterium sp.]
MTGTKQIFQELDENFRAAADPEEAAPMSAYMRNQFVFYGLREYSKTNPDWVREFIGEHRSEMAPLSIREGSKYI